jgi:phosphate transport system protein
VSYELKAELTQLRRSLLSMAAGVEKRVRIAMDALETLNPDVARQVRHGDSEIDSMEVDIEAECLRVLALHAPVANDLRFVLAAIRVNGELERIADLAKGVGKQVLQIAEHGRLPIPPSVGELSSLTRDLLADTLRALSEGDVDLAAKVRRDDARLDEQMKRVFDWADVHLEAHDYRAGSIVNLLFAVRSAERIGDLATNIAEDVIFVVGGQIVRHSPIT